MADAGGAVDTFRASDGYTFTLRRWRAATTPWARLTILHGARSHGQWYARSCREFADAGLAVALLERRGAGLNTARRGDAPGFRRLLDDVAEFLRAERRTRADLPQIVMGVSWGGKLAAGLSYRAPGLADGIVLACPGLCPRVRPPLASRLRILAARFVRPTTPFPVPLNDPDLFTADPARQAYLRANRYDLHAATARFLVASTALDVYLRRARRRVRVPVLTLLAGSDRVIDNARTRRYVQAFPSRDNRVLDYPAAHHTLEFEPPAACPFVRDVATWARRRFGR